MKISVILPAFNEESIILEILQDIQNHHAPHEVIVVDGGSQDRTRTLAAAYADVIPSAKGRAKQLNAGAGKATGDIFLFLHADTRLPPNGLEAIRQSVQRGAQAGRFRLVFDDSRWIFKHYQFYTRFHLFSYGDQGFFVTRKMFHQMQGFREDVPFEDIDFYRRLRHQCRPVILKQAVTTSARRFLEVGCFRQKFINLLLVGLYYLGVDVFWLKDKLYRDVRSSHDRQKEKQIA